MVNARDLTDAAVLTELGSRLARLRLQRNLTQAQLAREAGIRLLELTPTDDSLESVFAYLVGR